MPQPEYTAEAKKAKIKGQVLLQIIVNSTGEVTDVKVMRSLDKGLDERAVEAVRTWTFDPATRDGKTVAVETAVEITFNLYDPR